MASQRRGGMWDPIRPVFLMYTPDIRSEEERWTLEAIVEVLDTLGVREEIPIYNFGVWRERDYISPDGQLIEYRSIDWYIKKAFNGVRGQVDIDQLAASLYLEPWHERQPHYDVVLTALDLFHSSFPNVPFLVGGGPSGKAAIVSVRRFRGIGVRSLRGEAIKQAVMHELGHMFGAPDGGRGHSVVYIIGWHCTNMCAMRQGCDVPADWIKYAQERIATGRVYCDSCINDIEAYLEGRRRLF